MSMIHQNPYRASAVTETIPQSPVGVSANKQDAVRREERLRAIGRAFGVLGLFCPGTWMAAFMSIVSFGIAVKSLADLDLAEFVYGASLFSICVTQLVVVVSLLAGCLFARRAAIRICSTALIVCNGFLLGMIIANASGGHAGCGMGVLAELTFVIALGFNLMLFCCLRLVMALAQKPRVSTVDDG